MDCREEVARWVRGTEDEVRMPAEQMSSFSSVNVGPSTAIAYFPSTVSNYNTTHSLSFSFHALLHSSVHCFVRFLSILPLLPLDQCIFPLALLSSLPPLPPTFVSSTPPSSPLCQTLLSGHIVFTCIRLQLLSACVCVCVRMKEKSRERKMWGYRRRDGGSREGGGGLFNRG